MTPCAKPKAEHVTTVRHDGFYFYFACAAGDVTHTDNAFLSREAAELAADLHRQKATAS